MLKIRFALLGVLALFIVSGIGASTASATGGPFWHVNGSKLAQGRKQIKLQLKGTAVLKSSITGIPVTIECKNSVSEGASIEGSGAQKPGQDKGRLQFSQCKVNFNGSLTRCKVAEPITTNQTKSRLVTFNGTQSKYADLFEPQQGTTFAELTISQQGAEECAGAGTFPVKGSAVAELIPKEQEGQEGLIAFPETTITKVFWFGNEQTQQPEEVTTGLQLGLNAAKFSAGYGARLDEGGTFGVFST